LFPFFGTNGKQAWWNKHECNTVWKDALNPARIIPGTRISLKGKEQWNESSGKREGEVRS
jgi:hypothetical protein